VRTGAAPGWTVFSLRLGRRNENPEADRIGDASRTGDSLLQMTRFSPLVCTKTITQIVIQIDIVEYGS